MTARRGKIARLPHVIRQDLNVRLRDGESGPTILEWLNALPEVRAVLSRLFDGAPINAQNLTDWRQGGYAEWLIESQQYEEARKTTDNAQYICSSLGLDPSDALSVIITGHLVKLLGGEASIEDLAKLGPLFNAVTNSKKVGLDAKKFQRETCELFLKWHNDKRVTDVADNPAISTDQKTEILGRIMFGEDW